MKAAFNKRMVNFLCVEVYLFEIQYLSYSGPTIDKQDQALERTHFHLCEEIAQGSLKPLYVINIKRY